MKCWQKFRFLGNGPHSNADQNPRLCSKVEKLANTNNVPILELFMGVGRSNIYCSRKSFLARQVTGRYLVPYDSLKSTVVQGFI